MTMKKTYSAWCYKTKNNNIGCWLASSSSSSYGKRSSLAITSNCRKVALILLLSLVVVLGSQEATTTIDPELMLSIYNNNNNPQLEFNETTLHGGEEHDRFGNATISGGARSSRLTDEQMLLRRLLTNYLRSALPVLDRKGRVTVGLGLTITQIYELDERNEVLITNVWLDQEWYDEYLRWDPKNYSGIEMMRIPSSKIWLPDIVLYNNAADYSMRALETRAMVSSDGYIFWPLPTKLYSSCKVNVKYFPFDEQVCHMKFGSWTYDGFRVDLTNRTDGSDLSLYMQSGEWDLVAVQQRRNVVVYTCCEEPYPDVTFYVFIKRKTLYYLHNVFFPCFIMSTLTVLVFLLPPDSGEKCALGITVMLAFAVFMLSLIEKLPETSESVPLISIYLSVVMSMTAISVVLTVIALNLHHKTARSWRLATWILRILDCLAPICCLNATPETVVAETDGTNNALMTTPEIVVDKLPPKRNVIKSPSQHRPAGGGVAFDTILETEEISYATLRRSEKEQDKLNAESSTTRQIVKLTSSEFLQELEDEIGSLSSSYALVNGQRYPPSLPPDQALALAVVRMMERHRYETRTEDLIRDWRRLAETCDRILFWLFFVVITSFTFFILYLAPTHKLLD